MELLRKEFSELKTVMADQLMYVKEDLILPHHYTFYDFIVTKVSVFINIIFFCKYKYIYTLVDVAVIKDPSQYFFLSPL